MIASKSFEGYDFLSPRNLNRGHCIQHRYLNRCHRIAQWTFFLYRAHLPYRLYRGHTAKLIALHAQRGPVARLALQIPISAADSCMARSEA
jgi:hypothetical protein